MASSIPWTSEWLEPTTTTWPRRSTSTGSAARIARHCSGTSAGLVHVGFVDADLAANALAPSHVDALRRARSALRPRPVPVADAAAAIVRGIELRCPGGAAPGWVVLALALRGLLGPVARPYPVRAAAPAVAGVAPVAGVRAERG